MKLDEIKAAKTAHGTPNKDMFPKVFKQCYVKSTVHNVTTRLENADPELVERFRAYGRSEHGLWPKFLLALNNSIVNITSSSSDTDEEERSLTQDEEELNKIITSSGSNKQASKLKEPKPDPEVPVCPYCECPWSTNPSQELQEKCPKVNSDEYSYAKLTATCSYAHWVYKKHFTKLAELCHHHILEADTSQSAHKWPPVIDFEGLPKHIEVIAEELGEIVDDPELCKRFTDLWKEFKEHGSLKFRGLKGQYVRFEAYHVG
ncbi:hypothetical protein M422DRAFT_48071 [Sphaerobolus stellatus SS14]|uniref:Restriction of telomere capping protein 4 n=1 Tax=Sphaerobolus stellatus (strain SS14) TaxID=990650 RepID=A0A0C9UIG0_SPHS4|nr:hypothetical protein M422DRAFT_48071 [Sphaerobolus stellatus SS14]